MSSDPNPASRLSGTGSLRLVFVMLGVTLAATFFGELAIMVAMPYLLPANASEQTRNFFDAGMLAMILAAVTLPLMLHYRRRNMRVAQRALRVQHTLDQHAIVSITDVTGRITFANDRFCEISGYSRRELLGQNHRILKSGVHPPEVYEDMWHTIANGRTWHGDVCNRDKSGGFYWVHATITPFLDERGKPEEYVAIRTEITAQKELENISQRQEAWLRTILDNLGEGVYTLDAQGKVAYINAEGERLIGWRMDELVGKGLHDIIHHHRPDGSPLPATECPIHLAMRDHQVYRSNDEVFFRKDGSVLPVKITGAPLSLDGKWQGSVAVFSDMREERLLQQHLLDAKNAAENAARTKTDFLSTMSHEIRTPLNGVIGMTDLLLDTPLDNEQTEFANTIKTSADALMAIINDILDFSKIEAGRLVLEHTSFSLRQTVESSLDVLASKAQEKNLTLASFIAPELPDHLVGDPTRIRQILLNFLSNAIKFTGRGEVVASALSDAGAGADRTRTMLRLEVRDCGIGLSDEAKAGLFRPFSQADSSTTRKYGGTGLGLSICKRLVETMGGEIGVDSVPGTGSTFWVRIPLAVAEDKRASQDSIPALRDRLVMVAEGDEATRAIYRACLEAWQTRCEAAASLADLRRRIAELATAGRAPDVVLLGQGLPDATPAEALAALSAGGTRAIVCCLSRPDRELKVELAAQGAVVMSKPIKQSSLSAALLAALGATQESPGRRSSDTAGRRQAEAEATAGYRLLLAEDNPVNQRVAVHMLTKLGYAVDVVNNGALATKAVAEGNYALVLMDCQMPEMDGFAATAAIRRAEVGARRLPIVAMTANALQGDREQCLAAGMDDYISKPIDAAQLAEVLGAWLPRDGTGATPAAAHANPAAGAAEREAIDISRLVDMFGNDDEAVAELLTVFRESLAPLRDNLMREVGSHGGKLRQVAHELRGAAANVGAVPLAELGGRLEALAARADWREIESLSADIDREFGRAGDFVSRYTEKRNR